VTTAPAFDVALVTILAGGDITGAAASTTVTENEQDAVLPA
jgi:hypothetical protein